MKKIFILFAILFIAVTLNAQWFVGGQLGLGIQNEREKTEGVKDFDHNNIYGSFLFGPYFGYCINDKWCVGLDVAVGTQFRISQNLWMTDKYRQNFVGWDVIPFAKYAAFTYNKFSLQIKGSIGVGGLHEFTKRGNEKTEKGATAIIINVLNIVPILDFALTDHWHLDAELSFLNIGYGIAIYKDEPKSKTTNTIHNFNCIFNSSNVLTMNCLKIGAYYKF